ncbi:MAG TPA: hypothetical protein VNA04_04735 [Thermoanaerobaculia bacterium]|nr:hypothetical protein [Thermoanaerobaculia bacterium]
MAALLAVASASCRSTVPGTAIVPLRARTGEEALAQLRARSADFSGARSLMRVRATINGRTQSFRAQLVIPDRHSMELIAYTPVGTTAATIRADGDQVTFVNHVENSAWEGSAEELARSLSIYAASMLPSEMAMLLIGLPSRDDLTYSATPFGLQSASAADVSVVFDPPRFPPRRVTVRREADVVEIEHLEIVSIQ